MDFEDSYFDPQTFAGDIGTAPPSQLPSANDGTNTLSPDDPLRQWIAHVQEDPTWLNRFVTDHKAAVQELVDKGIPPPATPYSGEGLPGISDLNGQPMPGYPGETILGVEKGPVTGNEPTPASARRVAAVTTPAVRKVEAESPSEDNSLDPEENGEAGNVPIPQARPAEAGPSAADLSNDKQNKLKDAFGNLTKTLAGIKPVQPPPLAVVGTPSVRSPTAVNAPNIAQLLGLFGQQASPGAMQTLGRLLVAGKV